MDALADLRHFLRAKEQFHSREAQVIALLRQGVVRIVSGLTERLPEISDASPFTVPLICAVPDAKPFLDRLIGELWRDEYVEAGLFIEVSRSIHLNLCAVSGVIDPYKPNRPFVMPSDNGAPLEEVVGLYFAGTPLRDLLLAPVPLRFTHEERFHHMHVVGGTGAGKTSLLENLILADLKSPARPSLVVVDSQGDLIGKLSRLALLEDIADRVVLITPKDIEHPPAINIFDINRARLAGYDAATKEQVVAGVIQTFDYLFGGLIGADLTAKQGVFFRFVARLMLALPETLGRNATILDMLALMDDAGPYRAAIASLPPIPRQFFERDFASKTFVQTKEQIRYRLNAILENPTLARLFTAQETKVDLFAALNEGSVVLVDTAKDFLKGASSHFGRIFISLVLQAVLERAAIREQDRTPAFLIVDEAANYFDTNIDDLLTDEAYRKAVAGRIRNDTVRRFWQREFEHYHYRQKADAVAPIQNKIGALLADPTLYRILVSPERDIRVRSILDEGRVLLVNLSKGQIGEDSALTLGSLLVSTIALAAFSRADTVPERRRPFILYVDEFQNFTTLMLANMMSELRKYGVGLTLANQYFHQLEPDIRHAVLGNAGTLISFRVGPEDAAILAKEFQPRFGVPDLLSLPNRHVYLKLMVEGVPSVPFSATAIRSGE